MTPANVIFRVRQKKRKKKKNDTLFIRNKDIVYKRYSISQNLCCNYPKDSVSNYRKYPKSENEMIIHI